MLLPISPSTPRSTIYSSLNDCILAFFEAKLGVNLFDANIFPQEIRSVIWGSVPTRNAFQELWAACEDLQQEELTQFVCHLKVCQDFHGLPSNRTIEIPKAPELIGKQLSSLGSILYERTSNLVGIKTALSDTVHSYYLSFRRANGKICRACGMNALSEWQADVADVEQSRPPNDHYLSREHYPFFAVHPDNLIPICNYCNGNAKGRKNVACKPDGERRIFPNPWIDSYSELIECKIRKGDFQLEASFAFPESMFGIELEKAEVWNEIFKAFSRASGHIDDIPFRVDCLVSPNTIEELREKISERSSFYCANRDMEESGYWYSILLREIAKSPILVADIWEAISLRRCDEDHREVFGF